MNIHDNFTGGNIVVDRIENDTVYLERDIRDTEGDWFYWAFCAEGFAGRTVKFIFPSPYRVGRFGAAVSHDLLNWHWSESGTDDSFTYTFAEGEDKVYFCHDMYYHPDRFTAFCAEHGLAVECFCKSEKGRDVPSARFGSGDRWILVSSRHHCCESTGTYVLEGIVETLLKTLPDGYSVLAVPFVDYDGVFDGDQGKNRRPFDHNSDYGDSPIYNCTAKLMQFAKAHNLQYFFDFHSPWHMTGVHDHVFISYSTEAMKPNIDRFADILRAESSDGDIKYIGDNDVGPNEMWNDETKINSKNCFSRLDSVKLAVTLETPYFGLEDSKVSQAAIVDLGRAFGRSILEYMKAQ